jgi:signal transduction histidine kinase
MAGDVERAREDGGDVLAGGGAMGELMRATDWSTTAAGPVSSWPQSLRTVVGIMLSTAHPIFIWWGRDLVQLYNDAYRPILGSKKHPKALGQRGRECWTEIWDVIAPMIDSVFAGGATYIKDGLLALDRHDFLEECYFDYAYSPIRGERGEVAGIFVACNETSERVIGERRLKLLGELSASASEAKTADDVCRSAAVLLAAARSDITFALLYLVDDDGTTARLSEVVGLAPTHAAAAFAWPFDATNDVEVDVSTFREALPGGTWPEPTRRVHVLPLESAQKGAPHGFLVAGVSPRLAFDDAYRGFLRLVAGHIASAVQSANARAHERRRAEALAELDRAKTAFFSNVSHELRTPLTLILGPTERALATPERALVGEDLELVHRNEIRLQKLVNSLLEFTRIGAGEMRANLEPTDLATLTATLASAFAPLLASAGLTLVVDCPPLATPVRVDRSMWETVVMNLLSNAFKFTHEGEIAVRMRTRGPSVELVVADTGTGIAQEHQARIFERFHRVQGARGRSDEGSGIGLALVRELVKLNGGEITVESTPDVGTSFFVRLPLHGVETSPEPRPIALPNAGRAFVEEARQWLGATVSDTWADGSPYPQGQPLAFGEHRPRVMLVDDNADMRAYLVGILRGRFDVDAFADGETALAAARARAPDVVISDVMMPRLDGFGLLRELKADAATAHVPVVLVSARAGEEAAVEALSAGVADYIVKPFGARELLARVEATVKSALADAERARLLDQVEAANRRLRDLFDNAPAFVCTLVGPDHVFEMANPLYERLVGNGRGLVGKPVRTALPEIVEQGFLELLDDVYRTGVPFVGRALPALLDRDGRGRLERAFVSFVYQPRRTARGEIDGIDVFGFDMTEQVEALERAERLSSQLQLADQRKDEFLAMLAHELRNPMAAISLALSMVDAAGSDLDKMVRPRATARRQVDHLTRLVDDLLDVSRITLGKVELRKQSIDLTAVVQNAIAVARDAAEARNHELTVTLASGTFAVHADPTRLEQVVVNLLTNAAKYTDPGGKLDVRLSKESRDVGDVAVLSVRDNGRGIPRDMLAGVFDLFMQVAPSTARDPGGLGIGLTLVKGLVEMHGGTVEAHSEGPGSGSEFVVRIPLVDATAVRAADDAPRAMPGVRARRVAVVEDSEDLLEMLSGYLEHLGHTVITSTNGFDGARLILERSPDIAFVDVGLPGIDGYEVARRVRASPRGDSVYLVALTGYGGTEAKARAEGAGFDLHLTKPVDVGALPTIMARSRIDRR